MFVAMEKFISGLIKTYDKHSVSTDGGTWYPQACKFLKIDHHLHSSYEKSLIKGQYITSRIEPKVSMIIFHVKEKNVN